MLLFGFHSLGLPENDRFLVPSVLENVPLINVACGSIMKSVWAVNGWCWLVISRREVGIGFKVICSEKTHWIVYTVDWFQPKLINIIDVLKAFSFGLSSI